MHRVPLKYFIRSFNVASNCYLRVYIFVHHCAEGWFWDINLWLPGKVNKADPGKNVKILIHTDVEEIYYSLGNCLDFGFPCVSKFIWMRGDFTLLIIKITKGWNKFINKKNAYMADNQYLPLTISLFEKKKVVTANPKIKCIALKLEGVWVFL